MQNKKLLSVCLALILLCTCVAGMLVVSANAVTTIIWKVTGTDNAAAGEYATLQKAMEAAEAKTDWQDTDALTIEISASADQTATVSDELLFGVNTIFTPDGTKLPIVIEGGKMKLSATSGNVACTNDYTFRNVKFSFTGSSLKFFAGSGDVVLEKVDLSSGVASYFCADNSTAKAFENWTDANIAAAKGEDGLIRTSLTFIETAYANTADRIHVVGHTAAYTGGPVAAEDTRSELNVIDSKLGHVMSRPGKALSPVAASVVNIKDTSGDNSATTIGKFYCIGSISTTKIEYPDYDLTVNIDGGTFTNGTAWFRGAGFKGDYTLNISGGIFNGTNYLSQGDSAANKLIGNATANISGGTFDTVHGIGVAGFGSIPADSGLTEHPYKNVMNFSGDVNITAYYGSRDSISAYGKTITNVSENVTIGKFYGTYFSASGGGGVYGYVENNISGGTISEFYGSGQLTGSVVDIVNNISGGTIGVYSGAGNTKVTGTVINNFSGGTVTESFVGGTNGKDGGKETVKQIENHFTGGVIACNAMGSGARTTTKITNYFDGTEFQKYLYGSGGKATDIINYFRGGSAVGYVYGCGAKTTTENVTNYLQGGNWACGSSRAFFYGTCGTVTGLTTNYIEGEFTCDNPTNNANVYLTNGVVNDVVNHFHSAAFETTVYCNDGDFNTITNHFYGTFDSTAHGLHGAAGSKNSVTSKQERLITNNFYPGAKIGTFYGADGKDDTKIGIDKIVNNISGASITTFNGGPFRGYVNEIINNVSGDAVIADFAGGYSRGPKQNTSNAIIDPTITNNISGGTFTKFTGGNRAGHTDYSNDTITNNITGGVFNTVTFGSGSGAAEILGGIPGGGDAAVINNISGGSFMNDTVVEANLNSDCTVTTTVSGGAFYAKFSADEGNKIALSGNVCVGEEGQIVADEASGLTLTQIENWKNGHNYLILPSTFIGEVTTASGSPTVGGSGLIDSNSGMVSGLAINADTILASLDLQERVVVKLWFPKEDVDFLISVLGKPFEYSATLDANGTPVSMGGGKIERARAADATYTINGATKDYYVVSFYGIGAADFDNDITFKGTGFAFINEVLNFAKAGVETYAGTDYEDLFKAIYDYGATACGLGTKYDELAYTTDLAASGVSAASNSVANFCEYDALMGDAVGIRLVFTPGASFDASALTVKLDGTVLQSYEYQISTREDGKICVDVYFKASYMSDDFNVTVEAGGAVAVSFASSVERTVADIARAYPRNQKAIALLVYIQQVKAFLA